MHKANKISAFFFLGLFSLMLLHQVFPHLHHQHEESHSHTDIADSGEHHHNDNDAKEKEEIPSGFFDFFMDVHTHSSFSSEIVVLKKNTIEQQTIVDNDVAKTSLDIQKYFFIGYRQNSKPPTYQLSHSYLNRYLSSLVTRGPPTC
ncbi:hypothetical protein [uncultured Maribacter sp.]|uniref:hypothetical protein n=1 Tax=uncultured Maribacter sp. TaxID=431308 RepID=UPI0030EEB417|tara:strand:- start:618 stop:1055 length:438 start_codon:yes stop_codon:yes gene_type:complete